MAIDRPNPLTTPLTARSTLRIGNRVVMESEASATPIGLLAVGGLVAMILLSIPPIVRAKRLNALPLPKGD